MSRPNNDYYQPVPGLEIPRFAGVASFMRLPQVKLEDAGDVDIGLIGCLQFAAWLANLQPTLLLLKSVLFDKILPVKFILTNVALLLLIISLNSMMNIS